MRYLSKLLITILVISQLSACSFTAIGQRKYLAIEGDALAPYKTDIRGGWGSLSETYYFNTEQSIYQIDFQEQLTKWRWGMYGAFFLLPLIYAPDIQENHCKIKENFSFWITEITKQPTILFLRFSTEHFSFYDHETQKYFTPTSVKALDQIHSNVDIYHLPTGKKYLGADLFDNQQIYENLIEFSIDDVSCEMVTPDDKLMIQKPPYIDVIFTFFEHKSLYWLYVPDSYPFFDDKDGKPIDKKHPNDKSYSPEEVKHKVEPLSDVKNLEK